MSGAVSSEAIHLLCYAWTVLELPACVLSGVLSESLEAVVCAVDTGEEGSI